MNKTPVNREIFHGGKESFQAKVVEINGELYYEFPSLYKRTFRNETGGITTEYSLTPQKNEATEKDYTR